MKLNAAKQPFSLTLLISAAMLALFAARYYFAPVAAPVVTAPVAEGMPLASWLIRFSSVNPGWNAAIMLVLAVWIPYVLLQLTVRYTSATSRNYLPVTLFTAMAFGIAIPHETLASYGAALLSVLAARRFVSTFRRDMRFEDAFIGGFYLGMIPLLYAPGAILLPIIPLLTSLYRRNGRETAVSITGALLPFAGAWFVLWATGGGRWFIFTEFWRSIREGGGATAFASLSLTAWVCVGLAALLAVTGIAWFVSNRKGMRTRQRKVMAHTSLMFFFAALSLAAPGATLSALPLISVPAAMAMPYAFTGKQAALSSIVYFVLLAAVVFLNLCPLLGIRLS